jgi:cAMP-dependent protein kinase regulator
VKVCEFREGDHFGDLEFVNTHAHMTDAVCLGAVKVVKLNRYHVELIMNQIKEMLKRNYNNPLFQYYREKMLARTLKYIGRAGRRRAPVSSETFELHNPDFVPMIVPKDPEQSARLLKRLGSNDLFSQLDASELQLAVNVMARRSYTAADIITHQGESETYLFVVESGKCSMQVDDREPRILELSEIFGEMELLYNTPCEATIKAVTDVTLWTIDRNTYRHISWKLQQRQMKQDDHLARRVPFLKDYSEYELHTVAGFLEEEVVYNAGDVVYRSGDAAEHIVIVLEGSVDLFEDRESIGTVCAGEYPLVGDQELLYCLPTYHLTARAGASDPHTTIARLPKQHVVCSLSRSLEQLLQNPHDNVPSLKRFYDKLITVSPAISILDKLRLSIARDQQTSRPS